LVVQIIDRRRDLHLTQQQAAAAAGLHESFASRREPGVATPWLARSGRQGEVPTSRASRFRCDLRNDASTIVKRAAASGEPVFVTQHGRASAVLVSAAANRLTQDELEILRQLARGEADFEAGVGYDLDSVMAEADALLGEA
jgi:prevent-host-death family protein